MRLYPLNELEDTSEVRSMKGPKNQVCRINQIHRYTSAFLQLFS